MKQIVKKKPLFFTDFIHKKKPVLWNDIAEIRNSMRVYMLSGLIPNIKFASDIVSEQNFQCAYTEIELDENQISSHIDHFRKQSFFPHLRFEWDNLFTSTNNEYYGGKYKDNTYKIKQADYNYLINPALDNPKDFFSYSFTGEILIKPTDKNSSEYRKAELTKEAFNLNENSLVEQRKTVVKIVKTYFDQNISVSEMKKHIGKFDSLVDNIYTELQKMQKKLD